MIKLDQVGFRYGDPWVVRGLSSQVPDAGVLRLAGANGSGKTTVLKLILGLLSPQEGAIDGVAGRPKAAVFQENRLIEHWTALANVQLVSPRGLSTAHLVAEFAAIGLPPESLRQPVSQLSGGQRRRVAIVRALVGDAAIVGLDEPFTGLDQAGRPQVVDYIKDRTVGRDVVLITHDPAEGAQFPGVELALGE